MDRNNIKKVILAYSGGLDTSIIIPWLKSHYNDCEVIAVSGDVGQDDELEGLEKKALASGASKLHILDLKDEFVEDFIFPCLKANAIYEDVYLLGTAFARPLIGKKLVEIAKEEKADAICHGCTGKGNDQVRFELAIKAFAPDMYIIAPWREWDIKSRDEEIAFAQAHNIPLKFKKEESYSKDKNLWHLSHEGLDLENPKNYPRYDDILEMSVTPQKAPDADRIIKLSFDKGIPSALDDEKLSGKLLLKALNKIGGENGIGIIDMVENRLVGMKSRGIYETPGGTILYKAHALLETITLDKASQHYKQGVSQTFGDLLYNGKWYTPLRVALSSFVDQLSEHVCGDVVLKLYKGNISVVSLHSPYSLYDEQIASFDEDDTYSQNDAQGFINLYGLPIKVKAQMEKNWNK